MSIVKIVQLICDVADCDAAFRSEFGDLESATQQRRRAADSGWRRSRGRDVCPDHEPPYQFEEPYSR